MNSTRMEGLTESIQGLKALVITDRDGVVVYQIERSPGAATRCAEMSTAFSSGWDQTNKLLVGAFRRAVLEYQQEVFIALPFLPLLVILLVEKGSNLGLVFSLEPWLHNFTNQLANLVMRDAPIRGQ